jgi:colanic acid/amylovoran biosynthesis glycosyltransferase
MKDSFLSYFVFPTKKLYDEVNKCLAGHLPQKVEIAPMGVDLSRFPTKNTILRMEWK